MLAVRISTLLVILVFSAVSIAAQTSTPTTSPTPRQTPRQLKPRNETPNRVPTLALEVGAVTPVVTGIRRASVQTVCAGDKVLLRATTSDPDTTPASYDWISTGGQLIGQGAQVVLDTAGLPPGDYHVTASASYAGAGVCNGDCTAYDSKTIRISECPPLMICFTSPVITVTPGMRTVQPGEAVTFNASEVFGGQGYGRLTYTWKTSGGEIVGQGTSARLDTSSVLPGAMIEISVEVRSEFANCYANGAARVMMATPPPPPLGREMTPCVTFKPHNSRVDNACKYVLGDAARALQADAQARLVVDVFRSRAENESVAFARGKNVRDRLVDGSIGMTVDANRIIVRVGGVVSDGSQVRLRLVPHGATMPSGPPEVKLGPVETEKKPAPRRPAPQSKAKAIRR